MRDDKAIPDGLDVGGGIGRAGAGVKWEAKTSASSIGLFKQSAEQALENYFSGNLSTDRNIRYTSTPYVKIAADNKIRGEVRDGIISQN